MKADAIQKETALRPPDARLVLWWTAATALGYAVSGITYWTVAFLVPNEVRWLVVGAMVGVITGATATGLTQGRILRPYLTAFPALNWAVRTLLGHLLISSPIALYLFIQKTNSGSFGISDRSDAGNSYILTPFCLGFALLAAQGGSVGALQGLMLKSTHEGYTPWVFANLLALPASVIFAIIAALAMSREGIQPAQLMTYAVLGGAASGAFTGGVLTWMLYPREATD